MDVQAITRNVRISPEKASQLARLLPGKMASEAVAILEISPRKAAKIFLKTLKSAMANAVNNNDIEERVLVVKSAYVGPGAILRRFRPKARGSAGRIRKRTAHFTVVVTSDVK